jgi:peptide/nickel transport system permease protein
MSGTVAPPSPSGPGPSHPVPILRRAAHGAWSFVRVLRANPLSFIGFVIVALLIVGAIVMVVAPRALAPYAPGQVTLSYNQPPSWKHPFGTDGLGIDIYSEMLYALPVDLSLAFVICGVAMVAGGALGLVAGFWDEAGPWGRVMSIVVLRVTDVFLAFPSLILALAFVILFGGRTVEGLILAVLITWWPYYVRLVRGETLAIKHLPYITAARAAGVTNGRIALRHILRNVLEPVVVYFTLDIGTVLVTLSTIGFIGVGPAYPHFAEWGTMISYYQTAGLITSTPWTVLGPGLAIFVTVLAFSLLGDGLRDVLDPRSRRVLAGTGTGAIGAGTVEPPPSPTPATDAVESEAVPPSAQTPGVVG